jgi:hypothetical protein
MSSRTVLLLSTIAAMILVLVSTFVAQSVLLSSSAEPPESPTASDIEEEFNINRFTVLSALRFLRREALRIDPLRAPAYPELSEDISAKPFCSLVYTQQIPYNSSKGIMKNYTIDHEPCKHYIFELRTLATWRQSQNLLRQKYLIAPHPQCSVGRNVSLYFEERLSKHKDLVDLDACPVPCTWHAPIPKQPPPGPRNSLIFAHTADRAPKNPGGWSVFFNLVCIFSLCCHF